MTIALIGPHLNLSFIGLAIVSIVAVVLLISADSGVERAAAQRCPKCRKKTLRRKNNSTFNKWECTSCGNDEDEFGNKL